MPLISRCFFLNINQRFHNDQGAYIFKCGRVIEKEEFSNLFDIFKEDSTSYTSHQIQLYEEAFGENDFQSKYSLSLKSLSLASFF